MAPLCLMNLCLLSKLSYDELDSHDRRKFDELDLELFW